MDYETNKGEGREERRHITVTALVTFLVTFIFTFFLISSSDVDRSEISSADGTGTIEDGFCRVDVETPGPYLRCGRPVKQFEELRRYIIASTGSDFLAKCGDMKRHEKAKSSKQGVAYDSKHKIGQAFDYNQEDTRVLVVREDIADQTYWRTYLRCEKQDGTCGVKVDIDTDNAGRVSAYLFDFTSAAEELGWERIPAQKGWEYVSTKKEFWHYQLKGSDFFEGTESMTAAKLYRRQQEKTSPRMSPLQFLKGIFGFR